MTLHRHALPLWLFVLSALVACSRGSGEPTGQTTSALTLTPTTARIFGFEQATDWSGSSGTSTTRSEGARSVNVTGDGWKQIESLPFGPVGAIGNTVRLDVRLPFELPYWGEVRVIAKVPSAGVWWQELGSVSIQGLAPNQFHTLTFSLPSALASQIGAASDAVFIVAVNAPAGVYLVDNLRLSEPQGGASGTTGSTGSGSGGTTGSGGTSAGSGAAGGTGGVPQPGETGPATSEGTVQGEAVAVEYAFAIVRQGPAPQTTIVLSDEALSCELATGARTRPNLTVLAFSVFADGVLAPGTYQFFPSPGEALSYSVHVALTRSGDECQNVEQTSVAKGQITFDAISSTLLMGSYHVEFSTGAGSLDGNFVAPVCPVANQGNPICEQ